MDEKQDVLLADIVPVQDEDAALWDGKWRLNEDYRPIAEALVKKFPELEHVPVNNIIFLDNVEATPKRKGRYILAQIDTVPGKWAEIIEQLTGARVWYWMEIFKKHVKGLSKEQMIALIYHELRHVSRFGGTVGHDIEDWSNMVTALGARWNASGAEVPDLLAADVDWDSITAKKLFEEPVGKAADEDADEDDEAAGDSDDTRVTIAAAGRSVTVGLDTFRKVAREVRGC